MDEQTTVQETPADRMAKARAAKRVKSEKKTGEGLLGAIGAIREVVATTIKEKLADFEKRLEAVETVGTPSITAVTKDGRVLGTPGVSAKQTLPAREVRYHRPSVPEGERAWWSECPNGHVAAWFSGAHPWHPCAPEVIDIISDPQRFHRLKPGFDDRRAAIRGHLPSCTFCGADIPTNAAGVGSRVFNFNAKYLREGPPPDADEYGYPVR